MVWFLFLLTYQPWYYTWEVLTCRKHTNDELQVVIVLWEKYDNLSFPARESGEYPGLSKSITINISLSSLECCCWTANILFTRNMKRWFHDYKSAVPPICLSTIHANKARAVKARFAFYVRVIILTEEAAQGWIEYIKDVHMLTIGFFKLMAIYQYLFCRRMSSTEDLPQFLCQTRNVCEVLLKPAAPGSW